MTETTPISAAALGSMVAAVPTSTAPQAAVVTSVAVVAEVQGQFSSNTPEPLPLPDLPEPQAAVEKVPHPILQHFEFGHLPIHLAAVSQEFHRLAHVMHDTLPMSAELVAGLRKLLEAKDCMVRAAKP